MEVDSTCGYADREGFRCGTGDEFRVFNILTREKLKLKERPLIFMDDNHHTYSTISKKESLISVDRLIYIAKEYNLNMTLLFHNSIFVNIERVNFYKLYKKILEIE
jgi:hypothetical protein